MPRTEMGGELQPGVAEVPVDAAPSQPPPIPKPGDPGFMGPVVGGPPPMELRGRARFEHEANNIRFSTGFWGMEFNNYVLGLKEDPNDPEYNEVLRWAKTKAQQELAKQSKLTERTRFGSKPTDLFKLPADASGRVSTLPSSNKSVTAVEGAQPDLTMGAFSGDTGDEEKKLERERQRTTKALPGKGEDIFKGRRISDEEVYEQHAEGQDAYLNQFLQNQGVTLSGQTESTALKSGNYVYVGKEYDSATNTEHDVYMYVQDAEFALVDLGSAQIAAYQTALGLPSTGKSDPDLQKLWNYAVGQARGYAARGQKVTVKELMDLYVSSAAAENAKRGGGGGGGRNTIGETPEEIAAIDYYRAMMAVLGDISGVPDAKA